MTRPQIDPDSSPATTDQVIDVALESFARYGYHDTKLETIATQSRMTKRMIHYHFGDKQGLYVQALLRAVHVLRPASSDLELGSSVPVDGVRQIVEVLYRQMVAHPSACQLVLMENLFHNARLDTASPITDQSNVLLALDRLLMLGQDAGAFRPGISALDVYTIITSMCAFRISNRDTFLNLNGVDLHGEANTQGLRRLVVDTVLSFLTSNMSSSGVSYLTAEVASRSPLGDGDSDSDDIYGDGDLMVDSGIIHD